MPKLPEVFTFRRQVTVQIQVLAFTQAAADEVVARILDDGEIQMKAVSQDTIAAALGEVADAMDENVEGMAVN